MDVREIQRLLKKRGFDPGPIDGVIGPKTEAAIVAFKRAVGLRARPYVGPVTLEALRMDYFPQVVDPGLKAAPPWLRKAYRFLGEREIKGPQHNKAIVGWWEALKLPFRDDETPWCAGFMNRMVQLAGLPIPKKYRAAALGWRWTGHGARLEGPALGAVFSITRPGKPGSGHTGFVAGQDAYGRVMILGGNQGNAVSINPYHPFNRDAQYHWPPGYPMPKETGMWTLPKISSDGGVLSNEA